MENSNSEKLVELWEVVSKCPMCGGRLLTRDYRYNAPLVGDLIISVSKCEDCDYRHTDVFTMGSGEPRKVVYRVEEQGDDRALIVKSSTCRIEIPELGVTIEPGSYSQGYITTIEGIILDVKSIAQSICRDEEAPRDKCIEVLSLLEKAHNNEIPYTIVLYDYLGVCNIFSDKKKPIYEKL